MAARKEKSGKRERRFNDAEKCDLVDIVCNEETKNANVSVVSTSRYFTSAILHVLSWRGKLLTQQRGDLKVVDN